MNERSCWKTKGDLFKMPLTAGTFHLTLTICPDNVLRVATFNPSITLKDKHDIILNEETCPKPLRLRNWVSNSGQ